MTLHTSSIAEFGGIGMDGGPPSFPTPSHSFDLLQMYGAKPGAVSLRLRIQLICIRRVGRGGAELGGVGMEGPPHFLRLCIRLNDLIFNLKVQC